MGAMRICLALLGLAPAGLAVNVRGGRNARLSVYDIEGMRLHDMEGLKNATDLQAQANSASAKSDQASEVAQAASDVADDDPQTGIMSVSGAIQTAKNAALARVDYRFKTQALQTAQSKDDRAIQDLSDAILHANHSAEDLDRAQRNLIEAQQDENSTAKAAIQAASDVISSQGEAVYTDEMYKWILAQKERIDDRLQGNLTRVQELSLDYNTTLALANQDGSNLQDAKNKAKIADQLVKNSTQPLLGAEKDYLDSADKLVADMQMQESNAQSKAITDKQNADLDAQQRQENQNAQSADLLKRASLQSQGLQTTQAQLDQYAANSAFTAALAGANKIAAAASR